MYVIQYKLLCKSLQTIVNQTYKIVDYNNTYIVCEPDTMTIYGYILITQKHIKSSNLFEQLQSMTSTYYNIDSTMDTVADNDCYCIKEMQFKADLSRVDFEKIFNIIAFIYAKENAIVLLWKEHKGKLLFYPIELKTNVSSHIGFPSFVTYFTNNLFD